MRLLIVAMAESIHTARWMSQITDLGWDIHLFPSVDWGVVHPDIKNAVVHHSVYSRHGNKNPSVKFEGIPLFFGPAEFLVKKIIQKLYPDYRTAQLRRLIEKVKPDVVHSLEIQHAGYMTLEAKKSLRGEFPPWIVTNWGNDIYLFGRLKEHEPRIREVLAGCDYYSCECQRDVRLAREFGFKGKAFPVFPNTGGFDLERVSRLRQQGPTSERRLIMLKGYTGWAGRALVGLRALERCADLLKGYEIVIYSAVPEVVIAAELFSGSTGVPTKIVPKGIPHEEMLALHGQARVSIGVHITDGVSTSFLEALVMGSFPIQSWTACADEWIEDGITGILVPPEDPEVVEKAIRRAITDDGMVDRAAEENIRLAEKRLDQSVLKPQALNIYNTVVEEKRHRE
jgi:glycosyltransferase involved in cell wall biosynthesis